MKNFLTKTLLIAAALLIGASGNFEKRPPMTTSPVNGVQIAWTEIGDKQGEPVIMIMGLGGSHRLWGDTFPEGIAAKGYRVVMLDNRDVGGSQRYTQDGEPVVWWNFLKNKVGLSVTTSYSLEDMADDTVALLDHLNIDNAHIIGASMGGMIAQTLAVNHPNRTKSLVSIMSTTGAPHLPPAAKKNTDRIGDIAAAKGEERKKLNDMGFYPTAVARQLMAILDAGDRTDAVRTIKAPTLVLHGRDDTLIPPEHGEFTAQTIQGAKLVVYEGMEHNIPDPIKPLMIEEIDEMIKGLNVKK